MQGRTAVPIFWMKKLRQREIKEFPQGSSLMNDKTRIQTVVCLVPKVKLLTTQLCLPNKRNLEKRLREIKSLSKITAHQ